MVYKSLTFEQLQNLVCIGTLTLRWLTDFRAQMTSMVFFRYLHAYEHFEWGAKGFTQKSCNCPHLSNIESVPLVLDHLIEKWSPGLLC